MSDYIKRVGTNGASGIKQSKRGCMFCGREKVLMDYKGFKICMSCLSYENGELI